VFLARGEGDKYASASLERLRESLRQFLKACERAIDLNRTLISSEQIQFQRSIEEGFRWGSSPALTPSPTIKEMFGVINHLHLAPAHTSRDIKMQMAPYVQSRDPKRVMSFGIMQETNSDDESYESESEYTVGVVLSPLRRCAGVTTD
jgi:hypothetical protein